MKWLMTAVLLFIAQASFSQCLKADIVFIMDWSNSEDSNNVYIPTAVMAFVNEMNLGPSSVKVGLIPFNEHPIISHCLYPSSDIDMVNEVLFHLMRTEPSDGTSFFDSFQLASIFFAKSEEQRGEPAMKIIIFISDGDENEPEDRELTRMQTHNMRTEGVMIWCIATPIRGDYPVREQGHMKSICSQPSETFYIEENYYGLKEELMRLNVCP